MTKYAHDEIDPFIRARHALGWADPEIAAAFGCERHTIGAARRRLGLASNTSSAHRRRQVAARTRQQCRDAGAASFGALRGLVYRKHVAQSGWPLVCRVREVQILDLLEQGPRTRREICELLGFRWKGSGKSLTARVPGGSYLAHLQRLGLVVRLGRIPYAKGRSRTVNLYDLAPGVTRGPRRGAS